MAMLIAALKTIEVTLRPRTATLVRKYRCLCVFAIAISRYAHLNLLKSPVARTAHWDPDPREFDPGSPKLHPVGYIRAVPCQAVWPVGGSRRRLRVKATAKNVPISRASPVRLGVTPLLGLFPKNGAATT